MASSYYKVKVVNASGDAQVNVLCKLFLKSAGIYPGTATASASTNSDGVANIEVVTSGLYKLQIGSGSTVEDLSIANGSDIEKIHIVNDSGVSEADLTKLNNVTATATELNYLSNVILGDIAASKALTVTSANKLKTGVLDFDGITWKIGGVTISANGSDINLLTGLAGKTLATLDDLNDFGDGGSGFGQNQRIDFSPSQNVFVSGTYKTVYATRVKGNFILAGLTIFTNEATISNFSAIKINKISSSGTVSTVYENTSLVFESVSGMANGSFCNLLSQATSGTINSSYLLEVQLKIAATSIAATEISLHIKNTNLVIATGTTGGNL